MNVIDNNYKLGDDVLEEKEENERKKMKLPLTLLTRTSGLTHALQLIDFTSNEAFAFQDTTSATPPLRPSVTLPPPRETTPRKKRSKKR